MPFIPFAATVGAWLGGSAALGGAAIVAGTTAVASTAISTNQSSHAATASKNAARDAAGIQAQAIGDLQTAQNTASSQAQNALNSKRAAYSSSSDIFTSPLGLTTQATTAKKTLLGG